jgi:hypothetical protein
MAEKVVGLRGRAVLTEDGAEPDIIAVLERTLEQARAGEFVAIGLILIRRNLEIGSIARNPAGSRHLLVAGCSYLQHDLMAENG